MDVIVATLEEIKEYNFLPYAIPVFFISVMFEFFRTRKNAQKIYDIKDSLAATVIGFANVGIGILLQGMNFVVLLYFYSYTPLRIEPSWWSFILCLFAVDLLRYWAHRIAHEQRFWWATHVTHHSAKVYNFTVSFRLGWTQYIKIVFFIPIALLGFDPITFFICHQIAVLYQFWIHTTLINKMPRWFEWFFVTPSHHRVHHGSNPQYIDKNYGSTFIIWDRIFGTFEPEGEPVIYGITKPIEKPYNPIYLNFHEWNDLIRDVWKSGSIKKGFRIMFGSPAGLPEDIAKQEEEAAALATAPIPVPTSTQTEKDLPEEKLSA